MKKENQHFVPKSYLKNFSIHGKDEVYMSKFINQKGTWILPKARHFNTICYSENFYNVGVEFAVSNNIPIDFIERNAFWYERNYLKILVSSVLSVDVKSEVIDKIPEFFLNMISRNPSFKNHLDSINKERIIDVLIEKSKQKDAGRIMKYMGYSTPKALDSFYEKIKNKLLKQQSDQNLHSSLIFRQYEGSSEPFNSLKERVSKYKVEFGVIKSKEDFFITNDSPGFSIDTNGSSYPFKFKDDVCHFMPISSKIVLKLTNPIYGKQLSKINIVDFSKSEIDFINVATVNTRRKYVFCENKIFLNKLLQK